MKKRTITTLMACMLLLSGCSNSTKETQPAQTEAPAVTETTTAATEAADFVSGLEHISVQLPEEILRESVSETQDHFLYNGEIVGGIAQMDVDAAIMEAPFENEETILTYIKESVLPDYTPEEDDTFQLSSSLYGYVEVKAVTWTTDTIHYLLHGTSGYYDIWFDRYYVDTETEQEIMESVASEEITEDLNVSPVPENLKELLQPYMDTIAQLNTELGYALYLPDEQFERFYFAYKDMTQAEFEAEIRSQLEEYANGIADASTGEPLITEYFAFNDFDFTLPEGYELQNATETECDIVRDGEVVGGIVITELGEGIVSTSESDAILTYLETYVPEGLDYDWIRSTSGTEPTHIDIDLIIVDTETEESHEYKHYLFAKNGACYDLWLDTELVDGEAQVAILNITGIDTEVTYVGDVTE